MILRDVRQQKKVTTNCLKDMKCFKMKTYQKIYWVTFSWKTKNGYGTMCCGEQILFPCKFCKRILEKRALTFLYIRIVNLTQKFQLVS